MFLAKVIDRLELCARTGQPQISDFADPSRQRLASAAAERFPEISYLLSGGYPQAERRRLVVFPDFLAAEDVDDQITCLAAQGNFNFQKVSHRDYLGSLLALGLKREKFGDIVVGERASYFLVDSQVADYVCRNLTQIHRVPVELAPVQPEEMVLPEGRTKEIRATVASLRLDTVAAAGFGVSRTRMAADIAAEKVKLNWQTVRNPAHLISVGDILSVRGRGRVEVASSGGATKKGRISVVLVRHQ